jgi:hypothetical protein
MRAAASFKRRSRSLRFGCAGARRQDPAESRHFSGDAGVGAESLRTRRLDGGGGSRERTRLWTEIPDPQGNYREIARILASGEASVSDPTRSRGPSRRFPCVWEQGTSAEKHGSAGAWIDLQGGPDGASSIRELLALGVCRLLAQDGIAGPRPTRRSQVQPGRSRSCRWVFPLRPTASLRTLRPERLCRPCCGSQPGNLPGVPPLRVRDLGWRP